MDARRSVQTMLTLGALAVLVALVAVLGTWQVVAARNSQRSELENGAATAAHLASSALASALQSRLGLVSNVTTISSVPTVFLTKQSEANLLALELHLLYSDFASFAVIDARGTLLGRWPVDRALMGRNLGNEPVFVGAKRSDRPYVGPARQQNAAPKEFIVGLAAPVHDKKGAFLGIIEGTIPVRTLGTLIGGTSLPDGGSLVVFDQQGDALTGPAGGASRNFMHDAVVAAALRGRSGAGDMSVPGFGDARLVGYDAVPSPGWGVVAEIPPSELDRPIAALTARLVGIGAAVLVFAIATAILIALLLRRLRHEHEQQGAILTSVGEGVATLDPNGRVLRVNPALERLIEREAPDVEGRPWGHAFHLVDQYNRELPWDETQPAAAIRQREVVSSVGYDLAISLDGHRRVPVAVTAAPLVVQGDLAGAVIVLRDVAREREVDELKSSLVSTVSHELRTPLTMIQGFSELLLDRVDFGPERSHEALEQIHVSAKRLARLIDDLLSVSRIDSGKVTVEFAPVDLAEVIREVVTSFQSSQRDFILEVADALPRVTADRDKTVQVVTNLVSNAVKYSDGPTPIEIRATVQSGEVAVEVEDHGIGMTDEERSQIFEKFSRVDRPEVRRVGGTGLGLYITHNLVQLQRGRLWVTSRREQGSVFGFSLPLAGAGRTSERRAREGRDLAETLDR